MFLTQHLTSTAEYHDDAFGVVVNALSREVRDLKNNTIFCIRQLLTAHRAVKTVKPLQPNQTAIIARFDAVTARINLRRSAAGKSALPLFAEAKPNHLRNAFVIDEMVRDHVAPGQPYAPYRALPAQSAQQVVGEVCESFKAYHAAVSAFLTDPSAFTGHPDLPGYLDEGARPGVPFAMQNLLKAGRLTRLKRHAIAAWDTFPLLAVMDRLRRGRTADGVLKELRFEPDGAAVRILGVFEVQFEVAADSAVAALDRAAIPKNAKNKLALFAAAVKDFEKAGIDPGMNACVAVAFSNGGSPLVLDHRRYMKRVAEYDAAIDARQGVLNLVHPGVNRLPEDAELNRLRQKRSRFISNAVHQISDGLVEDFVKRKIGVVIGGRSPRLKENTAADRGAGHNRRAHRFPHHILYAQLAYKCRLAGIVFLETEESYTSKSSFFHNDPLKRSGDIRPFNGERCGKHFHAPAALSGWKRLNADIHAGYNMIRKVFSDFKWSSDLKVWFDVYWLSPVRGLVKSARSAAPSLRGGTTAFTPFVSNSI